MSGPFVLCSVHSTPFPFAHAAGHAGEPGSEEAMERESTAVIPCCHDSVAVRLMGCVRAHARFARLCACTAAVCVCARAGSRRDRRLRGFHAPRAPSPLLSREQQFPPQPQPQLPAAILPPPIPPCQPMSGLANRKKEAHENLRAGRRGAWRRGMCAGSVKHKSPSNATHRPARTPRTTPRIMAPGAQSTPSGSTSQCMPDCFMAIP